MGIEKGRRFDEEPQLNIKKVIATIMALIVIIMVVISVISLFKTKEKVIDEKYEYFSLHIDNKWGVINNKGEIVIEPKYDEMIIIPDRTKDVFIYNDNVNYENDTYQTKIINSKEEEILKGYDNIEPLDNFTSIEDVWYEKNSLKFKKDNKYGLITYEGNQLLAPEYDNIYTLKGLERSIILKKDGKVGLYNNIAKDIILEPIYTEIKPLGNTYNDGYIVKSENKKYGIIGPDKKVILEPIYDKVYNIFGDSIYLVKKDNNTVIVDNNGEVKTEINDNEKVSEINGNDSIVFIKNKKYGIMDIEKKVLIKNKYDYIEHATGNYYIAKKGKKYGIIDIKDTEKVEFKYQNITYRTDGTFIECENNDYTTDLYNSDCEYKVTGTISEVNTDKSYIRIRIDDQYKYYNLKFEEKVNKDVLINNTLFLIKEDGKYGFVNNKGNKVVDCIYDDATEQNEYGFCAIKKDGKWGAIKSDGTVILEPTVNLDNNIEINFIGKWHLDNNVELNAYTD